MGFNLTRKLIEQRWIALWVDGSAAPRTPTAFGNGPFLPAPDAGDPFLPPPGLPWVRLTILRSGEMQKELGPVGSSPGTLYRDVGIIDIDIFVPFQSGYGAAWTLADAAALIFRAKQFGDGITCLASSAREVRPAGGETQYAMVKVSTEYWHDQRF